MHVGVCYFPEHWPAERVATDVKQMADAGLEYVRMGEFAWSTIEPERGEFDFDWLDRAIALVDDHGMAAVLCTPTATPPKWLVEERPEILQEEPDGTVRHYGGRRHYCFNSDVYREESERITRALAERYADEPAVAGWQTDNEYGCHDTVRCYCDDCATAWREWLRERYGDAESLNDAWGTAFWSQDLQSISQADPPRHAAAGHHPSRLLDYFRFSSDSVVEFNREQVEVLREANDDWFVTHNFMSQFDALDAYDVCEDLDFASWDSYPTGHIQVQRDEVTAAQFRAGDPDQVGLDHDLMRSAAGAPPWVMEQQPGEINWPPYSTQPAEGAMRLWAHTATAHGAQVVSYFRWRRCLMGQEQYHSGLRERDGSPDAGYRDAAQAATDLATLAESVPGATRDLFGDTRSVPTANVAILHAYDNLWAVDVEANTPDFDYWRHLETYYAALRARSVTVDVVRPRAELDGYDAVVAPTLYLADVVLADRLESYVSDGGELLVTMRSGVKDPCNRLHDAPQPGPLTGLVGATVADHESVPKSLASGVVYDGQRYDAGVWNEWLAPTDSADGDGVSVGGGDGDDDGAEVRGRFDGGRADGEAAVVHNDVDEGSIVYVGTWPGDDLAAALVGDLLDGAGVDATEPLPDQVRLTRRDGLTWVTNFSGADLAVDIPGDAEWHVGGETVAAFDVGVTDAEPTDVDLDAD